MVELLFLDFLLLCGCISELSVVVHWCVYVYIYICVCVCVCVCICICIYTLRTILYYLDYCHFIVSFE